MTQTLYNCCTHIDASDNTSYRITKFVDGEVESSYLTTRLACDCPAGQRPTCRHRQMLPQMIFLGIVNQPYFIDWDNKREGLVLDFQGRELPPVPEAPEPFRYNKDYSNSIGHSPAYDALEPHSQVVKAEGFDPSIGGSNPPAVAKPAASWRRI